MFQEERYNREQDTGSDWPLKKASLGNAKVGKLTLNHRRDRVEEKRCTEKIKTP